MKTLNPVDVALTQNRLNAISQRMGWVMLRTARSPIFSQAHDFSCFLTNATGEVIAQADGIPVHTGSGGFVVPAILEAFSDIRPGDLFLLSDPYEAGGNHLPDWVVARPAFIDDTLIGFACNRAHQSDIGGGAAGTYNPAATEIYQEGIRLPVLRLMEGGEIRQDLWNLLLLNSRTSKDLDGDLRAMVGSTTIGTDGLVEVANNIGVAHIADMFEAILEYAHQRLRKEIKKLTPGTYTGEERSDNDCFSQRDIWIRTKVDIHEDGRITIDFTGTEDQIKGFKNSPLANTYSATIVAIAGFFTPDIPKNGGLFRCVDIIAPKGSMVNPESPAPSTMCTVFCAHDIIHAIWKALARADADAACAGWAKNIFGLTFGEQGDDPFVLYHGAMSAGGGAVRGRDGFNSIGHVSTFGGLTVSDIEVMEQQFPVTCIRQEFRCDSAGAGEFRGGTGVDYAVDIHVPARYSFRGEGLWYESGFGILGGNAGSGGEMHIQYADGTTEAAPKFGFREYPPIRLIAQSPGGGGYGAPKDRDPALVKRDLADGLSSPETARQVYGLDAD